MMKVFTYLRIASAILIALTVVEPSVAQSTFDRDSIIQHYEEEQAAFELEKEKLEQEMELRKMQELEMQQLEMEMQIAKLEEMRKNRLYMLIGIPVILIIVALVIVLIVVRSSRNRNRRNIPPPPPKQTGPPRFNG